MKANELMIGDWVNLNYWDGKFVQQINGISYNSWRGEGYQDWVDTEIDDEASIGSIEPIPLTAEILEKNGWEAFNGTYNIVRYRIITKVMALIIEPMKVESILGERWFWLSVNKIDGEVRPNMNYPFCYVHELQHALRLCGLNELADNFKIE